MKWSPSSTDRPAAEPEPRLTVQGQQPLPRLYLTGTTLFFNKTSLGTRSSWTFPWQYLPVLMVSSIGTDGDCKTRLLTTNKCSLQSRSTILNGQPVNLRSRSWIWMLCTEHLFSKKTWFCLRANGDSLIVIKLGWWLKLDVTKWKSLYKTWDAYHRPSVNNI